MTAPRGLHTLARLYGIQTAYHDNDGRRVAASPEALLATLRSMGVALPATARIPERVEHRRRTLWERALDPVVVTWTPAARGLEGKGIGIARLRTPARIRAERIRVMIALESGGRRAASPDPVTLGTLRTAEVAGVAYVERAVPLPAVPPGYHDLVVEVGAGRATRRYEALLIAAPERAVAWGGLPGVRARAAGSSAWGLFAPLYALHERGEVAPPTFALLGRFADRTADLGGSVVGTLPLLAAFLDSPYEPSPYAPVSRLFWNELYVEPRAGASGPGEGAGAADWVRDGRFFDPRAAMAGRRRALEVEARDFFGREGESGREDAASPTGPGSGGGAGSLGGPMELAAFRARNPLADDYARFRALTEALGPWDGWPDRLRARDVRAGDYDRAVARYHLYVQWRAERQLAEVEEGAAGRSVSLYLDLPMGVHPGGYDVWRERELFATDASAGAPPDSLAPGGQDWGFPPLHPEASRHQRHRYFIASIRKHLRYAHVLRIDHVMQLNRMFWVPGGQAESGVYVRYPAEELYAILCLESRRAGAVIVGEDLGTVPREVRRAMRRHGVPGMYVLEFELEETAEAEGLRGRKVRAGSLASIGTHDTPTFTGWWWGEDIRIRRDLGELDDAEAESALEGRALMREKLARGLGVGRGSTGEGSLERERHAEPDAASRRRARAVEAALLRDLGESDAGLVLAAVEDLWLEVEPQNVPGTTLASNWRRRTRRPLEALSDPDVVTLLETLHEARKGNG